MGVFGDDAMAWPRRFVAALLLVLALAGCSEEPAGEVERGPAGKTPVVRPEDVHGQGAGRAAAVLAPDYRQDMKPGVTDPPAPAKAAAEPAGRLFAAKPGQPPTAPPSAAAPWAQPSWACWWRSAPICDVSDPDQWLQDRQRVRKASCMATRRRSGWSIGSESIAFAKSCASRRASTSTCSTTLAEPICRSDPASE